MRRNPIRPWDHRSEPNVSTVEHLISARSAHAEGVAFVSTDGSGVNARSAEEVANQNVSISGSGINARSAFRASMVDVLCLTMRILVCKAEWLFCKA